MGGACFGMLCGRRMDAVERGFGFECDVYLSKDGRVFTFHDNVFVRGLKISEVRVVNDPQLSDHALLRCRLSFLD